jgi:hypothetical protein
MNSRDMKFMRRTKTQPGLTRVPPPETAYLFSIPWRQDRQELPADAPSIRGPRPRQPETVW